MKLPISFRNWTSLIGVTIAIISLFMIVFLFVISAVFGQGGTYLGLFIFIVLPVFLVIGLILIPIGMTRKARMDRKSDRPKETPWPLFDFNNYRTRNAFFVFTIGSTIFLLLSAVGSYEAFHYTESVEFCGKLCHVVMEPEYVAYQNSPHAKVACVDCHVGSGANWYMRSKLSGLYQVYAVTIGGYPTPIPTPITNLRPARETCEECHWPEKFYAHQHIVKRHYLSDEQNTEWDIYLKMKIGAGLSALGLQEGIHWHINPDVQIEYISSNDQRDTIPWVRYTNKRTGEVLIYTDEETMPVDGIVDESGVRTMDCMDCHNRPSHDYETPQYFIDDAITAGLIPKNLPEIKYVAMEYINDVFSTTDSVVDYLTTEITGYYQDSYPELYDTAQYLVDQAISGIISVYKQNMFPEMKVKWDEYPNRKSHVEFNGCFRCHDDNHVAENGHVISRDCNSCHTIMAQGNPDDLQLGSILDSLEFVHPINIKGKWKRILCFECHAELFP